MSLSKIDLMRNSVRKSAVKQGRQALTQQILPQPDPIIRPTRDVSANHKSHSLNVQKNGFENTLAIQRRIQHLERELQDCEFEREANIVYNQQFKILGKLFGNIDMEFEELKEKVEQLILNGGQSSSKIRGVNSLGASLADREKNEENTPPHNCLLDTALRQMEKTGKEKDEQIQILTKQIYQTNEKYQNAEAQLKRTHEQISTQFQSQILDKNNQIAKLINQIDKVSTAFREFESQTIQEKEELQKNNEDFLRQISQLQQSLTIYKEELEKLQEEMQSVQGMYQNQTQREKEEIKQIFTKEIENLEKQLQELNHLRKEQIEKYEIQIKVLSNTIQSQKNLVENFENENYRLEQEISHLQEQIQKLQPECMKSASELAEARVVIKEMETHITHLEIQQKQQIKLQEEKQRKLVQTISQLQEFLTLEKERTKKINFQLNQQIQKRNSEVQEISYNLRELNREKQSIQSQLTKEKQQIELQLINLAKQYETLNQVSQGYQQNQRILSQQLNSIQNDQQSLKKNHEANLEQALQNLREKYSNRLVNIQNDLKKRTEEFEEKCHQIMEYKKWAVSQEKYVEQITMKLTQTENQNTNLRAERETLHKIQEQAHQYRIQLNNMREYEENLIHSFKQKEKVQEQLQIRLKNQEFTNIELNERMNSLQEEFSKTQNQFIQQISSLKTFNDQKNSQLIVQKKKNEKAEASIEELEIVKQGLQDLLMKSKEEWEQKNQFTENQVKKNHQILLSFVQESKKLIFKYLTKKEIDFREFKLDMIIMKQLLIRYEFISEDDIPKTKQEDTDILQQKSSQTTVFKTNDQKSQKIASEGYQYQVKPSFEKQIQKTELLESNQKENNDSYEESRFREYIQQEQSERSELKTREKGGNDVSSFEDVFKANDSQRYQRHEEKENYESDPVIKIENYASQQIIIEGNPSQIESSERKLIGRKISAEQISESRKSVLNSQKNSGIDEKNICLRDSRDNETPQTLQKNIDRQEWNHQYFEKKQSEKKEQEKKNIYPSPSNIAIIQQITQKNGNEQSSMINQLKEIETERESKRKNLGSLKAQVTQSRESNWESYKEINVKNKRIYFRVESPNTSHNTSKPKNDVKLASSYNKNILLSPPLPPKGKITPNSSSSLIQRSNLTFHPHKSPQLVEHNRNEKKTQFLSPATQRNTPQINQAQNRFSNISPSQRQVVIRRQLSPQQRETIRTKSPVNPHAPNNFKNLEAQTKPMTPHSPSSTLNYPSPRKEPVQQHNLIKFQSTRSPSYKYSSRPITKPIAESKVCSQEDYYGITAQQNKKIQQQQIYQSGHRTLDGISDSGDSGISVQQRSGECCPNC